MKKGLIALLVLGAFTVSSSAIADEEKKARANDVVDAYVLKDNGVLTRKLPGRHGKQLSCDLTSGVQDFKISQHPNDAATAYFIKNGDLHYVKNSQSGTIAGQCPPAKTGALATNIKREGGKFQYGVIPSTKSEYVNWALDGSGIFYAWKNSGLPMRLSNVADVSTVECFGQKGKSFSKKILLLESRDGGIFAMEDDGQITNQNTRSSIKQFRFNRDVCKEQGGSSGSSGRSGARANGAR